MTSRDTANRPRDTKIVHMIGSAHLDPVWLWPWQDGTDEVLATYRTACDLLDDIPEFMFSHGEAWTYRQVELLDPELLERIRSHVRGGRWEIVGGWWIQPDCNLPSGFGIERQIELGKEFFLDRFGFFPEVAFNVDSFGHAASLPDYMRAAGQKHYVMTRPQEHEKDLPARLFRWRGREDGPEVVTFRIAGSYAATIEDLTEEHILKSVTQLPDGVEHTMCFYGVGDHGGGPTLQQINWIREHQDTIPGCRLVFSSPGRFFEAVAGQLDMLPLVTGELQMHAVGCYTVEREIKTLVRRAEHALRQAELLHAVEAHPDPAEVSDIAAGWERVCFNQFHDILAGTCIPSAYGQCYAQLGYAISVADNILHYGLRRKLQALPDDPLQRVVLFNASDTAFDGYLEFEPWLQWQSWQPEWRILDERGLPVPLQQMRTEAVKDSKNRLLVRAKLLPGAMPILRIDRTGGEPVAAVGSASAASGVLTNGLGAAVSLKSRRMSLAGCGALALPNFELIEDLTDTWSHGIDRYSGEPVARVEWGEPSVLHEGPLMAGLLQLGKIGDSTLRAEWRVYYDSLFAELRLRVNWQERQKVLKLRLPLQNQTTTRVDGIPGSSLVRENDGKERPLTDWTMFDCGGARLGIVCPEVFALDATPEQVNFTLLRSPLMAHHDPAPADAPAPTISDQGIHDFVLRFHCGNYVSEQVLSAEATMLQRPLLTASQTRGMPRSVGVV